MTHGQTVPVIIDCDTGVDDALALLFAVRHPGLDLRAVTCVAGNTDVAGVVRNTLTVLEQAGAPDIPVARGAERPLIEAPRSARHVHGHDGMGDLGLPAPRRTPADVDAVTLLRREILASPRPVTLVPTAPLTNIALLLRTHPEVTRNIERIVFMGGAAGAGNATAVAEFNVWHDPEAAAILLTAGVPITMYGLDVFTRVVVPGADVRRLRASTEPGTRLAGELLAHRPATPGSRPDDPAEDAGGPRRRGRAVRGRRPGGADHPPPPGRGVPGSRPDARADGGRPPPARRRVRDPRRRARAATGGRRARRGRRALRTAVPADGRADRSVDLHRPQAGRVSTGPGPVGFSSGPESVGRSPAPSRSGLRRSRVGWASDRAESVGSPPVLGRSGSHPAESVGRSPAESVGSPPVPSRSGVRSRRVGRVSTGPGPVGRPPAPSRSGVRPRRAGRVPRP
ncbi:inosine-uridine nucleoside N-ribohydrolase [Streptomyces calvus]